MVFNFTDKNLRYAEPKRIVRKYCKDRSRSTATEVFVQVKNPQPDANDSFDQKRKVIRGNTKTICQNAFLGLDYLSVGAQHKPHNRFPIKEGTF